MSRIAKTLQEDLNAATDSLWWGYKHTSGTFQAKRYFGPLDTDEARDSPFCEKVVGPFKAKDRDDALKQVKQLTT